MIPVDNIKMVAMASFTLLMGIFLQQMLQVTLYIDAEAKASLDPKQAYLHSIALHTVSGDAGTRPFIHYMVEAVNQNQEVVEGVNVSRELARFQETFELKNSTGGVVARSGTGGGAPAYYAVPDDGVLVMKYRWVQ